MSSFPSRHFFALPLCAFVTLPLVFRVLYSIKLLHLLQPNPVHSHQESG